jgi:DNA-binding LytR/AlgR family response regulator
MTSPTAATRPAARAVIADDERLMRDQLRQRLAEVWPELEIVAEAPHGEAAVAAVERHRPDLVFLDIRMPGLNGIEAAQRIAALPIGDEADEPWPGCEIVFITAYDEYAVQAFEHGALDYVLKPAERERLELTVRRLATRLAGRADGTVRAGPDMAPRAIEAPGVQALLQRLADRLDPARPPRLRWIQAAVGTSIQLIPVDDVLFFVSDEKYTRVQTSTVEALIRKPIKELLQELDLEHFWQIHRSTVVNVAAITGVIRDDRGRQVVTVRGRPERLEVSRSFQGLFRGM